MSLSKRQITIDQSIGSVFRRRQLLLLGRLEQIVFGRDFLCGLGLVANYYFLINIIFNDYILLADSIIVSKDIYRKQTSSRSGVKWQCRLSDMLRMSR